MVVTELELLPLLLTAKLRKFPSILAIVSDKASVQVQKVDYRRRPVSLALKLSHPAAQRLHQVAATNADALKRLGVLAVRLTGAPPAPSSLTQFNSQPAIPHAGPFPVTAPTVRMNAEPASASSAYNVMDSSPGTVNALHAPAPFYGGQAGGPPQHYLNQADMYSAQPPPQHQQPSTSAYGVVSAQQHYHHSAAFAPDAAQYSGDFQCVSVDNGAMYNVPQQQQQQQVYYEQDWSAQQQHQFVNGDDAYWSYQQQQQNVPVQQQHYFEQPPNLVADNRAAMMQQPQQQRTVRMMHPHQMPGQNNSPLLVNLLQQQSPPSHATPPAHFFSSAANAGPSGAGAAQPRKRRRNTASSETRAPRKSSASSGKATALKQQQQQPPAFSLPPHVPAGRMIDTAALAPFAATLNGPPHGSAHLGDSPCFSSASSSPLKAPGSNAASFSSPGGSSLGGAPTPGPLPAAPMTLGRDASINSVIDSVMLRVITPGASPSLLQNAPTPLAPPLGVGPAPKFSGKIKGAGTAPFFTLAR